MPDLRLIKKGSVENFHKYLFIRFVEKFGYLASKVDDYPFYTTMMPNELAIKIDAQTTWYPIIELSQELEKQGLVRYGENRLMFYLTPLGYAKAQEGSIARSITWLNSNQGGIAFASLLISIAALICA